MPTLDFKSHDHYSKVTSRSYHDIAHLHPPTNKPIKSQLPTCKLASELQHRQDLKVKVTMAMSKVKSRIQNNLAYQYPKQYPYQVSTLYTL